MDRDLFERSGPLPSMSDACSSTIARVQAEGQREGIPLADEELGSLLHSLVLSVRASRVTEVGTATGYSALWLASAAIRVSGHVTSIEIDPARAQIAVDNLQAAGLAEACSVVVGDATRVLESSRDGIDLLFLDGAKEDYIDYLDAAYDRLGNGSLIVCDNVFFDAWPDSDRIHRDRARHAAFVQQLVTDPRLESHLVPCVQGVSISVKRSAAPPR